MIRGKKEEEAFLAIHRQAMNVVCVEPVLIRKRSYFFARRLQYLQNCIWKKTVEINYARDEEEVSCFEKSYWKQ